MAIASNRIRIIQDFASELLNLNCVKTAKELFDVADNLRKREVPAKLLLRVPDLFSLLKEEFVKMSPLGKQYRNDCFEEIALTVLEANERFNYDLGNAFQLVVWPLYRRIVEVQEHIRPIMRFQRDILLDRQELMKGRDFFDLIENVPGEKRHLVFHLYAYTYLVLIEGIFDELARVVYFFKVASKNSAPELSDLERLSVWKIIERLSPRPIFLQKWEDKCHIRNAIGHARVTYDAERNVARFVDVAPDTGMGTYDETFQWIDFLSIHQELLDTLIAFRLNLMLFLVVDAAVVP